MCYLVTLRVTCPPLFPKLPTIARSWYSPVKTAKAVFIKDDFPQPCWPTTAIVKGFPSWLWIFSLSRCICDSKLGLSIVHLQIVPHTTWIFFWTIKDLTPVLASITINILKIYLHDGFFICAVLCNLMLSFTLRR